MKVLQVVGDSKFGGATYLILEWCRFLVERGWQVDVLSTDVATVKELKKIPALRVIDSIHIPRDIELKADLRAINQLTHLIRSDGYSVVHTHTSTPGFIGRVAAWRAGVPIRLHTAHGWPVTEFSSFKERLLYAPPENLAARLSTRVICVSESAVNQAMRFKLSPKKKLTAICNGIDPEPFLAGHDGAGERLREELGLSPDCLLIGNTSRLAPQKDVESLIRAVPLLLKGLGSRKFAVLLAGDGTERARLEELSAALGVEGHVRFLGFRRDIPEFLSALDIFVSPSLWEGLSVSVLEAMAAAKLIVTTNIEPNAELIRDGVTGLLVPPRSPGDIAVAIARFAQDKALGRCATAARYRLLERFTLKRMFEEQWRLYQQLEKQAFQSKRGLKPRMIRG
jgi:glycosyltransferase involved in cell wall biosynthesis